ncbi:penicillin acylase family protein [Noviluteimonas gilva]|uniref:Penicillin acylase family protein n=1 Tax=Noviluteimonas gilva TaxID=2682097 RepID=A0A7C9HUX9_9GAMM|nr:penicillin acylase family protein [Lysobacter gilvus]MUV15291.1 penicillin acylase family protein [Lysobacter gilvus]
MRRWMIRIGLGLLGLLLIALFALWLAMRASLPKLEGTQSLPGLSAPVTIQRDALGVVTINAANETDALRALGYVHAQERFFEMDLMRRSAAGELSGLFGEIALGVDKAARSHRMRARVQERLNEIAGDRRAQLEAYTQGVNAGLDALSARPWAYLVLRQHPKPWRAEDTPLVGYAMYFDLQDAGNKRELALWKLQSHVPPALYALLTHDGSSWDAPLTGPPTGDAKLPGPDALNLRDLPVPFLAAIPSLPDPPAIGSNNFAVSGDATRDGRAILANDMHLALRAPNIWFRTRLRYPDARAEAGRVDLNGVTLPGMPAIVVGSNGHVAWGFTNGYIDAADWGRLVKCGEARYRIKGACVPLQVHRERIEVAGGSAVDINVEESPWGPVLDEAENGDALALRWSAHLPGSLRLAFMDMAYATDVDDALRRASRAAIPAQNLLIAGKRDIAWRVIGPLPQRAAGCDAPMPDAGTCAPWGLRLDASPVVARPTSARLWSANARTIQDRPGAARLYDGNFWLGVRAHRIRSDLFERPQFDERALLEIQTDDRAVFLYRWWQLMQAQAKTDGTPALHALADASRTWEGRAMPSSVSFRIVKAWRRAVLDRLADGLTAPAQAELGQDFVMPQMPQLEGVAWPLVTQRPMHLLPRRYKTWTALFEDAAKEVRADLEGEGELAERTWGEANAARICHPLARALFFARKLLCMPADPLSGDATTPRAQSPDNGASERMVVSPGHEADGIFHMPGGQSGHPLSPYWGAGHDDWVQGRPTPFLPGPTEHTLTLN